MILLKSSYYIKRRVAAEKCESSASYIKKTRQDMGGSFVHTLATSYDLSLGLVSKPSFMCSSWLPQMARESFLSVMVGTKS